jgi:transcriptional regulator with XRE-family HTH domain
MPAEATATEIGQNIRAEMGRRRINMSELSRRTGISRTTLLHQIDVTRVTVDNLVLIAQALDLPIGELVGESVA